MPDPSNSSFWDSFLLGRGAYLDSAIQLAAMAHYEQKDKAGQPYILHPLRVMLSVETDQQRIVAVLHDAVEDCPWITPDRLKAMFGTEIALALVCLTRITRNAGDVRQKESYLFSYIPRVYSNALARRVKIADLRDNLLPQRRRGNWVSSDDLRRARKYVAALELLL